MVDRSGAGSWLDGPGGGAAQDYPGQRLGRPQSGPGSVGRFGRRLAALLVDWAMCTLIAWGIFRVPLTDTGAGAFVPNAVFLVENIVLLATLGSTFGHRILGLRVTMLDGSPVRPSAAVVRSLLLALGLPALFWNADQRGLHDQLAGTVVARS